MNKCINCGGDTYNPKFCNRSCAATFNNKGVRRNGKKPIDNCLNCSIELKNKRGNKKYCTISCQQEFQYKKRVQDWLEGKTIIVTTVIPTWIKRFLLEEVGTKCSICGWCKVNKTTNKTPLEVDHIDGDATNNKKYNLRILCPNCHSLTNTYKNIGSRKSTRTKRLWKKQ